MQRVEVVFRGRVQGVGFRFTVQEISKQFQVTGFVRNEEDGSVRLVAEGLKEEVQRFLHAIQDRMADFIRSTENHWSEATHRWSQFSIEH